MFFNLQLPDKAHTCKNEHRDRGDVAGKQYKARICMDISKIENKIKEKKKENMDIT